MAMRRCLMKLQNTGLCARSNCTSGLLSKQHPHHHQLKLHGIRALSEGARGTNSSNPDSKSGSPLVHHSLSLMKSEIENLQIEMKKMQSELRHISELTKSNASKRKDERSMPITAKIEAVSNYNELMLKLLEAALPAAGLVAIFMFTIFMVAGLIRGTVGIFKSKD